VQGCTGTDRARKCSISGASARPRLARSEVKKLRMCFSTILLEAHMRDIGDMHPAYEVC